MNMKHLLFLLFLILPCTGYADIPTLTEEQRVFIEDYVEAAEQKSDDLYWDMIHPESRACMSESFKKFVIQNFIKKADNVRYVDYEGVRIEPANLQVLEKQVSHLYRKRAYLSVQPNYMLESHISVQSVDKNTCTLKPTNYRFSVPVAFHEGEWYEVMPCGRDDLEVFLKKQLAARAEQKRRVDELYDSVPQSFWAELEPVLMEDHDAAKAIKRLEEIRGFSLSEAKAVIGMRCERLNGK